METERRSMDSGRRVEISPMMSPKSMEAFRDGISLLLSQWSALQLAVRHEWGGCDSSRKCDELVVTLLSWFSQSKVPIYIDDLEHILDENLVLSFNTEIMDGSVEEISEQLLLMHEDCLHGNYDMIERLRRTVPEVRLCDSEGSQGIISDEQVHGAEHRYLVRWKDQPPSKDTWMLQDDLEKIAPSLVEDYPDFKSLEKSSFESGRVDAAPVHQDSVKNQVDQARIKRRLITRSQTKLSSNSTVDYHG